MALGNTLTTVAYTVKRKYIDRKPMNVGNRKRVFLEKVPKKGGFTGKSLTVALTYANPQAVGATFSKVRANMGTDSPQGVAWEGFRRRQYGMASIDAETIAATEGNDAAFIEAISNVMDGTYKEMNRRASIHLYGAGSGKLAKIATLPGSNVITFVTPKDVRNFAKGQKLEASATETGGAVRAGSMKVTKVDRGAGSITVDNTAGITGLATSDFLYNEGDYDLAIHGLAGWIPTTAPGATAWFGIDRTDDTVLLGGNRVDATTLGLEEGLLTLASDIQEIGGDPDVGLCSPTNWTNLSKKLGSKVERPQGGTGTVGFQYIEIATAGGIIRLFPDPDCPPDVAYLLQMDSWILRHLRDFPHVVMDDGLKSLRVNDDDGIEIRWRYWAELFCLAPAYNGVAKLA